MKKPRFDFGTWVVPSLKAFENGVFQWQDRQSIVGVVVWSDDQSVRVHRRGNKKSSDYHVSFWAPDE